MVRREFGGPLYGALWAFLGGFRLDGLGNAGIVQSLVVCGVHRLGALWAVFYPLADRPVLLVQFRFGAALLGWVLYERYSSCSC